MFEKYLRPVFVTMRIVLGSVLLMPLTANPASACIIDSSTSKPMPLCSALATSPDTDVVVIESYNAGGKSNILLGPNKIAAESLNIVIGNVKRPLTVVVSHFAAAVLNFSGNVNMVEKVVAMGARGSGWDHVAINGIEAEKLRFLPVLRHPFSISHCNRPPNACVPAQYFDLKKERLFAPDTKGRYRLNYPHRLESQKDKPEPTTWISGLRTSTILIPPVPEMATEPVRKKEYSEGWRGELERYKEVSDERIVFDKDKVLSPVSINTDPDQPSWVGLASLIEQGHMREAGDYEEDPDLRSFSKALSEMYRSRFDPEFRFEPILDFIVAPKFSGSIPRNLRRSDGRTVTFLATDRRPSSPARSNRGNYCLFSYRHKLAQAANRWTDEGAQTMCKPEDLRPNSYSGEKQETRLSWRQFQAAEDLEKYRKSKQKPCGLLEIPEEAEIVVLSTEHGRLHGRPHFEYCEIESSFRVTGTENANEILAGPGKQCRGSEVDISIDREGPVFLFLKGRGAIQWNLTASERTKITGVATLSKSRATIKGLQDGVSFNQFVPGDDAFPEGCRNAYLRSDPVVGGPAILLFEKMFENISGRKIDALIRKGLTPAPEEQTPEVIKNYTSFVVD